MTTLVLAAALAPAFMNDGWKPAAPYVEGATLSYDLVADLDMGGNPLDVEIKLELKTTKKTDSGFEGTGGFAKVYVQGEEMDGMSLGVTLGTNGLLKSVTSDMGSAMRRMFMAFYFCYPTEPVGEGGKWTVQDETATDGHKAKFEYTLGGTENVGETATTKVTVAITEDGAEPMKADGTYWVASDGKVMKFELNMKGWPVPVAGQAFSGKIKGTIAK